MRNFHNNDEKTSIHPLRSARQFLEYLPLVTTLTVPLLLGGCADAITGLEFDAGQSFFCEPATTLNPICGLSDSSTYAFLVRGRGTCGTVGTKYGDGDLELDSGNFDTRGGGPYIYKVHKYTGQGEPSSWPGPKIIHAYPANDCAGEAKLRVEVLLKNTDSSGNISHSSIYRVGLWQPTPTTCAIPNTRPLRAGAIVHVTQLSSERINFGCAGESCTYNMNGSSAPTPPNFPFPNHGKHSLVFRIVAADGQTQLEQGIWADPPASFVVQRDGPLEFCVNDTILSDNIGAWGIGIRVDETNIP